MKTLLLIISFFLVSLSSFAQWEVKNSGVTTILQGIAFTDESTGIAVGYSGKILKTTDGGNSWIAKVSNISAALYAVKFYDQNLGIAVGDAGSLIKTTDGGENWTEQNRGAQFNLRNIYFLNSDTIFYSGRFPSGTGGYIYRSTDGGNTWTEVYSNVQIQDLTFINDSVGFACGYAGTIIKTTNGGLTWNTIRTGGTNALLSVCFTDAHTGYFCGENGLALKTLNQGNTFITLNLNFAEHYPSVIFVNDQTGYIFGGNVAQNRGRILKTKDAGHTWSTDAVHTARLFRGAMLNENTGYAVGLNGAILKLFSEYNTISGYVFKDENKDCLKDAADGGLNGVFVKAEPGPYYGLTDSLGFYSIKVGTGNFQVSSIIGAENKLIKPICGQSLERSFVNFGNESLNVNFANEVIYCSVLSANISSNRRRRCFNSVTYIDYRNEGTLDANNVILEVEFPEYVIPKSFSVPYGSFANGIYTFNIGTLNAESSARISIIDSVICGNESIRGLTQCTKVTISPVGTCFSDEYDNAEWDKSSINVKGQCVQNEAKFIITNGGSGDMEFTSEYRVYANDTLISTGSFKLEAGEHLEVIVNPGGKTIRLEADQHSMHPGKSRPRETVENCGISSANNVIISRITSAPLDNQDKHVDISCLPIIDSYDPNDKNVVPAGIYARNFIRSSDDLEYTIRFQNTGSDTAYTVIIKDTLSNFVNVSSLRMTGSSHSYVMTYDHNHRVISWTFNNIYLPDSITDEPGSNGYLKFIIEQNEENTVGTVIENEASIFFDYNSAIITNKTDNEIWDGPLTDFSQEERVRENVIRSVEPLQEIASLITIFPVPFKENLKINLPEGIFSILILSIDGRIVFEENILSTSETHTFKTHSLSDGFYLYKISFKGQFLKAGKLIKG